MRGVIDAGHEDEEKLEALADFRDWLLELRENNRNRLPVRRDGRTKFRDDGTRVFGPFTLQVRQAILNRLKLLESQTGQTLIVPAEIEIIADIWRRDRICEDGRLSLLANVGVDSEHVPA